MKYFPNYNLLFIHIPRTGGTSTCDFLWTQLEPHEYVNGRPHEFLNNAYNYIDENTKMFTIIRNPYDRAVSFYHKLLTQNDDEYPNAKAAKRCKDFKEYVSVFCYNENPQINFIKTDNPICRPWDIEIVRFENLVSDLELVLNNKFSLNLDFNKFPHLHGSKHRSYETYYTSKEYELVTKRERAMFDLGYYKVMQ